MGHGMAETHNTVLRVANPLLKRSIRVAILVPPLIGWNWNWNLI